MSFPERTRSRAALATGLMAVASACLYAWCRRARSHAAPTWACLLILSLVFYPALWLGNYGLTGSIEQVGVAVAMAATRLPNRRCLEGILAVKLPEAERYGRPLSLLLFDVDRFKSVNDTLGHTMGDAVLAGLGQLVRDLVRSSDACARWGGEEFVVLCSETDRDGALVAAERLRHAVEQHRFADDVQITISIGLASHRPGDTVDTLFARADHALYAAKRAGRNRVMADRPVRAAGA